MTLHSDGAAAPGLTAPEQPTSETARVTSAGRIEGSESNETVNFRSAPRAGQALRVIDGEAKASDYLARLHAEQADPDELAVIVSMLYGATLRGFCSAISKALRGVRHE